MCNLLDDDKFYLLLLNTSHSLAAKIHDSSAIIHIHSIALHIIVAYADGIRKFECVEASVSRERDVV